ncbi:MAG: M14-type cytosolic carboxypeptidase [Neisseriaceae bacterium]
MNNILVNTKFDGGSIVVVDIKNPKKLQFKIRNDTNSHFAQWFYFQLSNVKDQNLNISFLELANTAYPEGWKNYSVCASYDNEYWFRIPTQFDGNTLRFSISPEHNSIYFAYFEPYSYERHLQLIGTANSSEICSHEILGQTYEGRNIDLLVVGSPNNKFKIWFTARQHPGETMAEWFMEGLISRLLDDKDSTSKSLLKNCVFYMVPNMNPDGAYNGNLRTNSVGTNLNREWLNPSLEKSPEVYYVRNKMQQTSVDMSFDIHGDEAIPYVFLSRCIDSPTVSSKQQQLAALFTESLLMANPDFQTQHGYELGHFNSEASTLATSWIGDNFDCLAYTLEMPFKDNDNLRDEVHGWSGYRSYLFGHTFLSAIYSTMFKMKGK